MINIPWSLLLYRFPTSLKAHGSDAMHSDPDYSAAYVILTAGHWSGHGFSFTLGRGTQVVVEGIKALIPLVNGVSLLSIFSDFAAFWRKLTSESQLRWLGPETGVIHLAVAAIVNGLWDLWGKVEGKPVWKLLSEMSPEEIVSLIDFRYLSNVLTKKEAISILQDMVDGREEREKELSISGCPAYTTSAAWLGYSEDQLRTLCNAALKDGFKSFKIKVGQDLADDLHRCKIVRDVIGWNCDLMMDANQRWEVDEAIHNMHELAQFKPLWIEEPTSPDDVMGNVQIVEQLKALSIGVASGESCNNRVMFKQFLQAGAMQYCQIDATRVGGVNENIAIILLAAKHAIPVCPHAGGVGLCELVQHLAIFNHICVANSNQQIIEYVEHLHEHMVDPVTISNGHYMMPNRPGYSSEIKQESREMYQYPNGSFWKTLMK